MCAMKKNVLILSVVVVIVSAMAFFASSMLVNAKEGAQNASDDVAGTQRGEIAELSATKLQMFRLYNPYTGEHFYTSNSSEKANLVKIGWKDEGIGWVAPTKSNAPVYRLNNPFSADGDHHYTMSASEKDTLVKAGWQDEGIGWYSVEEGDSNRIPLYRQYNPWASSGSHNYTADASEQDSLVKAGWKAEGIAWYGYDKNTKIDGGSEDGKTAIDFSKAKVDADKKEYKAAQWKPSASITGLTKDKDYTVTYGANKNAGKGTITITGKGNYTGSKTYTFEITQKVITSVTWGTSTFTYDGKSHVPTATAVGVLSADVANFKVTVSGAQTNAGTHTAKAAAVSNSNYKLKSNFTKNFTVNKKEVTVTGIRGVDKKWDGSTKAELDYGDVVINGKLSNDKLGVEAIGEFVSSEISDDPITINIREITLTGDVAKNYKLASKGNQTTTTAKIYEPPSTQLTSYFDTQGHGNGSFDYGVSDGHVFKPTEDDYGTADDLELEGWYTEPSCKNKWIFDTMSTTKDITLYANWRIPDSDEPNSYWIAPAKDVIPGDEAATRNEEYVQADWNVKKSSTEIDADIKLMKQEAATGTDGEGSVTAQYKEFMKNDNFHLYTKWNGTIIDGGEKADYENSYAEFRIIGVGTHHDGDEDESILTFQSVYVFPEAQAMKADGSSQGGWASSDLRTCLNGSSFLGKFSKSFTDKIVKVPKVSMNGGATDTPTDVTDPVSDKLWLASVVELTGTSADGYVNEGSQYEYYSTKSILETGKNPLLIRTTRAGNNSVNNYGTESGWWTRSPHSEYERFIRIIGSNDNSIKNVRTDTYFGVVPCFCF